MEVEGTSTLDISPIFFIEIGRIKAGTTDCVLLQQFFSDIVIHATEELYKILDSQSFDDIGKVEGWIKGKIERSSLYSASRENGLEIVPSATILNRISEPLISPGVFFYLCDEGKSQKVEKELSYIKETEINTFKELSKRYANSVQELKGEVVGKVVTINKTEGKLLGYPRCCVSEFIKAKEEGRNHETEIALQCLKNNDLEFALDCFLRPHKVKDVELPDSFYSHFTSNFYPCSVDCKKAIGISKRNEKYLSRFSTAYKGRLILNVLYHLAASYGSYQIVRQRDLELNTEYRKYICSFFDRFDADSLQFMEKVKDLLIYSPHEVGDAYIRKAIEVAQKDD